MSVEVMHDKSRRCAKPGSPHDEAETDRSRHECTLIHSVHDMT